MSSLYGSVKLGVPKGSLSPKPEYIFIEDWNFRFHYRFTTILLLMCVAVVTFTDYIGSKIHCLPVEFGDTVIESNFLETYCFIRSTYTVHPVNKTGGRRSQQVGGGPQHITGKTTAMPHGYYPWIPFLLLFQAWLFYFPHLFWKRVENHRLQGILQKLHIPDIKMDPADKAKAINTLGKYIWDSRDIEIIWSIAYVICEYLNFLVVFVSVHMTDYLLDHHFYDYGIDRLRWFSAEEEEDNMDLRASARKLFPTVSKCDFYSYGAGGSIQKISTMCILPMNMVNEKVFTFLWFWFLMLAATTGIFLIYRAATLFSFRLRQYTIVEVSSIMSTSKQIHVLEKMGIRGWILLKLLSLNLEPNVFQRVMLRVHEEVMEQAPCPTDV